MTTLYRHQNGQGELHRIDGPAVEYSGGCKEWYLNGELHCETGPAVIYSDGTKAWWLNGTEYSEEEFKKMTNQQTIKRVKISVARDAINLQYQAGLTTAEENNHAHRRLSEIQSSNASYSHKRRLYAIWACV